MAEHDLLSYDTVASSNYTSPGVALIIVNQNFTSLSERKGAHEDFRVLTETFKELGFKIIALFNVTDTEILAAIKTVSAMDHSSHANFIMAVSSHGDRRTKFKRYPNKHLQDLSKNMRCDSILGVNEGVVDFFTLTSHFMEGECPMLRGKPKLFFIQPMPCMLMPWLLKSPGHQRAWYGSKKPDNSVSNIRVSPDESSVDGLPYRPPPPPPPRTPPPPPPRTPPPPPSRFRGPAAEDIPIWRDCLLACSTIPDYYAVHNIQGSWFIRELRDVLLEQHEQCDLLSMLTEVNWRVTKHTTKTPRKPEFNGLRTMPWIASMLRKQVWL